jgi:hypothetical protein
VTQPSLKLTHDAASHDEAVLRAIMGRPATRPIPLAEISDITGLGPREIKGSVERLREAGMPVGASRCRPSDYFWASSPADLEAAARPMLNQAFTMLRGARRLLGARRLREMAGQATIDSVFGEAAE